MQYGGFYKSASLDLYLGALVRVFEYVRVSLS